MSKTHLQAINISFTRLADIKPTVFKHLPSLESIDLRYNQFNHIERSFVLHPSPTVHRHPEIFLSGKSALADAFEIVPNENENDFCRSTENPWNCSKNFKWLMNYAKTKHIIDRESMQCNDTRFRNQSILTVMNFKWVILSISLNDVDLFVSQAHTDVYICIP